MKVVVLCGGEGTRLAPALPGIPKAMAPVAGRPFLEWLLLALRSQGLHDVILATGYLGDQIGARLGAGDRLSMRLTYARESQPMGTGGAIRLALGASPREGALVLNGDSYCPLDLKRFRRAHREARAPISLWLVRATDPSRYGTVELDRGGEVRAFREKTEAPATDLISAGIYLMEPQVVAEIPGDRPVSLEREVLPAWVGRGLHAVVGGGPFVDIGTPESFTMAAKVLSPELERLERDAQTDPRLGPIQQRLRSSAAIQEQTAQTAGPAILQAAELIAGAFRAGNKLLLCGNGGSAADAQHVAAEFVSVLSKDFARGPLPALALTTDTSFLTAYANDFGFEGVFERQVRALGKPGDVLVVITTSGASENVRRAITAARELGLTTIGLVGEGGRQLAGLDCPVVIPSRNTQLVQESLLPVEHLICDLVEQMVFSTGASR